MLNKNNILKLLACLLIILPFLYTKYSIFGLISILVGLFILVNVIFDKKSILKKIILYLIIFIFLFGVDFILTKYFKQVPVISYEIKSSKDVSTYNSLFYRVYNCNKVKVFDAFYQKNYICDNTLDEGNINSLLPQIVSHYFKYHNKFINVNGKISGINGSKSISMQIFSVPENSINGQVNFSDNITLTIINNGNIENIETLKIYDEINIIGRIVKIKRNGQNKEIIMKDAKIINQNNFDNYEINVVQNKSCESDLKLISKTDEYNYYSHCLNSIFVKYDENSIYDLDYVLTDKRMNFNNLVENINKKENEIQELYEYDEYNIIKCKNTNNIIIGTKNMNLETNYCENIKNLEEIEQDEGI